MCSPHVLISCGCFNPITIVHVRMFELAKHHLKSKKNIVVEKGVLSPTNDKYALIKPTLSPAHHRIAMINLALKDVENRWIVCDDWETRQEDWIRTLPALRHYETVYGKNLRLLCGADLLESFLVPDLWSDDDIEEILRSYGIIALPRPGSDLWKLIFCSSKSDIFKRNSDRIEIIDDSIPLDISSTMVRQAVKEVIMRYYGKVLRNPQLRRFIADHPNISSLANFEKLCKLRDQVYVICPEYCCGEFWESLPHFCCPNNSQPIRNLFFFLLTAFVCLFTAIITYLFVEYLMKIYIKAKLLALRKEFQFHSMTIMPSNRTTSDDASMDDENSVEERNNSELVHGINKLFLFKHSESFKNMSKINSVKRLARSKSELPRGTKVIELPK